VSRIGIVGDPALPDAVREAGAEPVLFSLPQAYPEGGVALRREWVTDLLHVEISASKPDALLLDATTTEELAGLVLAALRLDLPAIFTCRRTDPFPVALAGLGLAPFGEEPARLAVEIAEEGGPTPGALVGEFSLANALRAGLSAGGGPELLVHLSAIARAAKVVGFPRMARVLAPESPAVADAGWLGEHGSAGLLAHLGESLREARTVEGDLKELLPEPPPAPEAGSQLVFVEGRRSGAETVCVVPEGMEEVAGRCRFFVSEESAARSVRVGRIEPETFMVVSGYGPRGGPGIVRLERLARTLQEHEVEAVVLTDGLPPERAEGLWFSLFAPEVALDGIIGCLQDGDDLRMDLTGGRIRTGIGAEEMERRRPLKLGRKSTGYAARYARLALPALQGGGFG
jgi:dihydroxy-acid dehydratase